jgi:hypothetical protein
MIVGAMRIRQDVPTNMSNEGLEFSTDSSFMVLGEPRARRVFQCFLLVWFIAIHMSIVRLDYEMADKSPISSSQ